MADPYANLAELLSSYYHRDWMETDQSVGDVLVRILHEATPARLQAAGTELDHLLASGLCEPQLRDLVLYELGCHIDPEIDGIDLSRWLLELRREFGRAH